jgi:glucose-6-phosphate-specific signal transduction histidine kinase
MITLLRSIVAVVIGYIVFAASAFAIFRLSGHDPHAPASAAFMLLAIVAGAVFAMAGGYVAAWIAGRRPVAHAVAMAAVLAAGATVSLASTVGHGAVWSQVAALVLMAPSAVVGGWCRARVVE